MKKPSSLDRGTAEKNKKNTRRQEGRHTPVLVCLPRLLVVFFFFFFHCTPTSVYRLAQASTAFLTFFFEANEMVLLELKLTMTLTIV